MEKDEFQTYSDEISNNYRNGDYTEYTNRTPIENLITRLDDSFELTHEGKREAELGAPDFKARRNGAVIGYIETKDLDKNLSDILGSEQIERYRDSIDNVILTNYSRFILLRNSEKALDVRLFEQDDLESGSLRIEEEKGEEIFQLLSEFYSFHHETIESPRKLALEMSKKAQLLKELSQKQLESDQNNASDSSTISQFRKALEELIDEVSNEFAADAFAETVTYGLFLARMNSGDKIEYDTAFQNIPKSVGIIRKIFLNIAGDEMSDNISWLVEEITELLNATDIDSIRDEMDLRGKTDRDPFAHFYEYFLSEYDETRRQNRGEYYTPRPVVSFISNMVNHTLKENFDKRLGVANNDVKVLDPAVGTGTFLWITYILTIEELENNGLKGVLNDKIKNHILKDFYGIELMFTPYIIAHLKLSMILEKFDYDLDINERIQVYLSNTLEPEEESSGVNPFLEELDKEKEIANQIKREEDIIAILGNPPYSGQSENQGDWITGLLKNGYERADGTEDDGYYRIEGEPLDEQQSKWLQDDYVKFIRFSQWKIDQNGKGVVGLITNHSYLNNPTFRGMRESLMQSFDRIYIVNLHGNQRRKEEAPENLEDENVFDIKQGVCITIFVRNPEKFDETKVLYSDKWGSKDDKFGWLDRVHPDSDSSDFIRWEEINPKPSKYHFVPRDEELEEEYQSYWKLRDIFRKDNAGIVTSRDGLTIKKTEDEVWETISEFKDLDIEEASKRFDLRQDSNSWKIEWAQNDLNESGPSKDKIVPVQYRPFDYRYTYYTGNSNGFHSRPGSEVMEEMLEEDNIGLCVGRQGNVVGSPIYDVMFVTDKIVDFNLFRRGGEQLFPLWLHGENQKNLSNFQEEDEGRKSNINPKLISELEDRYGENLSSKQIFSYIYAILRSRRYRKIYADFIDTDYPRIPFPETYEKFESVSNFGNKLVDLHLMRENLSTDVKFNVSGNNTVENADYEDGKIYINDEQFFSDVPQEVWDFHIGGYNVLEKWLKYRKSNQLSSNEVEHFRQVVPVIQRTIEITNELDDEIDFI